MAGSPAARSSRDAPECWSPGPDSPAHARPDPEPEGAVGGHASHDWTCGLGGSHESLPHTPRSLDPDEEEELEVPAPP